MTTEPANGQDMALQWSGEIGWLLQGWGASDNWVHGGHGTPEQRDEWVREQAERAEVQLP